MKNAINWFEIPVNELERAKDFYEHLLEMEMEKVTMESFGADMAFFPSDWETGVGGALVKSKDFQPSLQGSLVYLNGGDDLSKPLSRVESSGGKVILQKTAIGDHGFIAMFLDTEGNRVAFHSQN